MYIPQAWSFAILPVLSFLRSLYLLFSKVERRLVDSTDSSDGEEQLFKNKTAKNNAGYFEFSSACLVQQLTNNSLFWARRTVVILGNNKPYLYLCYKIFLFLFDTLIFIFQKSDFSFLVFYCFCVKKSSSGNN